MIAFVLSAGAFAMQAATFNLACSGTLRSESFYGGKSSEPFSYIYRIDLDRGIYCDGECKATRKFAAVLPTQLQLDNDKIDSASETSTTFIYIDRETGEFHGSSSSKRNGDPRTILLLEWKGACEKRPFTSFPSFETKF